MPIEKIDIDDFLQLAKSNLILDARSPGEFQHAHVPGAYSLPLFTDEERKVVGTAYKQQGRKDAIKIGLDYFGVKMRKMVEEVEAVVAEQPSEFLLVHCWRGGMRSEAIAWLLNLYGFKVCMLKGGYKKFRNYVLDTFALRFRINVLSGYTGSGKTSLLHELERIEKPVVDLENIANHKGSAFGGVDQLPQPSQEMFENSLALQLRKLANEEIWIEDESRRIGSVSVPPRLWEQMQTSNVYFLNIPFEARLSRILTEYGQLDKQKLIDAIARIQKRLGGLETKTAIKFLEEDNYKESFSILLRYYDKCYYKSTLKRTGVNLAAKTIESGVVDEQLNMNLLLENLEAEKINT